MNTNDLETPDDKYRGNNVAGRICAWLFVGMIVFTLIAAILSHTVSQ